MNGGRLASGLLVAALAVASVAALIVNQRIRADGLLLEATHLSGDFAPDGDGSDDAAAISFRVTEADHIDVFVVDSDGARIRRLAEDQEAGDEEVVELSWNGLDDQGRTAPTGAYTLRIELRERGRTITPGQTVSLEEEED